MDSKQGELKEKIAKERESNGSLVSITIKSHVPSKWRFVDLETGDIWKWDDNTLKHGGDLDYLGYVQVPNLSLIPDEKITPEVTIRMIEAFLTAFRLSERTGIATQIYNALFTVGYHLVPELPVLTREQIKADSGYTFSDKVWDMIYDLLVDQRDADLRRIGE